MTTTTADPGAYDCTVSLIDGNVFHVEARDELDALERAGACAGQDVAHLVREIEGPFDAVA